MKTILPFLAIILFSTLSSVFCLNSCPPCGNISVPCPLSTDPSCGDPKYKLYCDNKMLAIRSVGGTYHKILSMDPSSYRFIISPPSISPGSCISSDLMEGGFHIDENSPFNISNRNTVMLFNCSESLLLSPLNCSSNSVCRKFEEVVEGISCRNTLCCSYLKDSPSMSHWIRVRVGACNAYTSVVAIDEMEESWSWKFGLELQWLPLA